MATANTLLRDSALRHAHALEKFKNGEVRKILALLNRDLYPALIEELQSRLARIKSQGYDMGVESTKRLRDMVKSLEQMIQEGMNRAEDKLTADIHGLSKVEAKAAANSLSKAMQIEWEILLPSPETLKVLATQKPFSGSTLSEHFEALTRSSQVNLRRALNIGLTSGETFEEITSRIQGTKALRFSDGMLEMSRRQVRSVVGAAVQHAGAVARQATYQENADIIKAERFSATLDSRTCAVCASLDGQEFPLGEGPQPPVHLGPCRCQRIPVLKSWKELGLDAEDVPDRKSVV